MIFKISPKLSEVRDLPQTYRQTVPQTEGGAAYKAVLQRRSWLGNNVTNGAAGGDVMEHSTISNHSCRSKTILLSRLTGFTACSLGRCAAVKRW